MQLIDTAGGLKFLHQMSLVHENIRGVCFAIMAVNGVHLLMRSTVEYPDERQPASASPPRGLWLEHNHITRASINWTTPELLTPDSTLYQPSVASDIYALAMVTYEVSTTPPIPTRSDRK